MSRSGEILILAGLFLSAAQPAWAGHMVRSEVPGELVVCFESDADQVNLNEVAARWNLETAHRAFVVQSS
jgi:hypothetical protein